VNPGIRIQLQHACSVLAMGALGLLLARPGAGADFSFGEVGTKNDECLACHSDRSKVSQRVQIDRERFSHTTHGRFGCRSCHDGISASHPDGKPVAQTTTCRDCHDTVAAEYGRSIHAGKADCGGCHNPHRAARPEQVSGDDLNRQCGNCHKKETIIDSHSRWLPQAGLHMESIACVACHSKASSFVVSIYLTKQRDKEAGDAIRTASYAELSAKAGSGELRTLIDRNRDNYLSLDELRQFNRNPDNRELYLRGMIVPVNPTHDFRTFDDRWNCTFCHASGPEIMQTSYLALPRPDGTYTALSVERGAVLDALQTIPDFYLMGSARNTTLNKIGLAIIAGGLVMPVGHGFLRFLTRKNR
jgi:predicted CXXCH cytochrome family protein